MMVSYIQSNYAGFGSGVVIPETGIAMQNRGAGFSLERGHPNEAAGRKRPYQTIIPGFLTRSGQPVGPFGVMGGLMQPQGHTQVVVGSVDYGLNPQAVLDAPRWRVQEGLTVDLEREWPEHILRGLADRGHAVNLPLERGAFGRGQIIWQLEEGVYVAGSDRRADGAAVGW
jgi:gamma-glutamyltranspeptidase/glutathione hydrolase